MNTQIYYGVAESRDDDPKKLGRCKVRIVGLHSEDKVTLPTKDLPWAYPLMPVFSASMSGIGYSPTGIVEGTWCAITFRDEHNQHPVIIGTIGGIPEDENVLPSVDVVTYKVTRQTPVKDAAGNDVLDGGGNPVVTGPVIVETITEPTVPQTDIKKPYSMTVSPAGIQFIQKKEALSSLVKGKNVIAWNTVDPNTPIFSYKDSLDWAIGYGTRFNFDGSPVTSETVILAKDAPSLLNRHITAEIETQLKKKLVAPLTQQMYDAIIDMSYNAGVYRFMASDVFSSLNTGKYKDAAALIPFFAATVKGAFNQGVTNRRLDEQKLFMSGGIPNASFTDVDKDEKPPVIVDPKVPPVPVTTTTSSDGDIVETITTTNASEGFRDPNGKYPTKTLINEPDTHRLARGENIYESIVFAKEASRTRHVRKFNWITLKDEWDQPEIPYNAKYPFNQTRVTESGHVDEWDDTKDCERIHRYHRAGTYEEIDRNGSRTTRIVGDDYEILERHGNLVVKGNVTINVMGDANIRAENDLNLEVLGNMKTRVTGNYDLRCKGRLNIRSELDMELETLKNLKFHADVNIAVEAAKKFTNAAETISETASRIDMDDGSAPAPYSNPELWEDPLGVPEFGDLVVITRTAGDNVNYESPSEGDSTIYREQAVIRGDFNPDDQPKPPEKEESVSPPPPPPLDVKKTPMVPVDVSKIDDISMGMRLSPNYKLSDVSKSIPKDQAGKTAKEIVGNLKWIANNILEPIRARFPNLVLTTGWRSDASNKGLVGASKKSDHLVGAAIDMKFTGFSYAKTFEAVQVIQAMVPTYNQILVEYKGSSMWLHVAAYGPDFGRNNARRIGTLDVLPNKFTEGSFKLLR
jgi:GH24 family phage-related lysozyme (muramidase)